MRLFHFCARALVAGMYLWLTLGIATEARSQNALPGGATVTRLQGKARFSTDNKTWRPAKNGAVLGAGTIIQTADNSTMDLRLGDGEVAAASKEREPDMVRLAPNSVLVIEALGTESSGSDMHQIVELDLRNGEMTGRVGQLVPESRYEVKFSTGVAGIRNGSYRVTSSGIIDAMNGDVIVASVGPDGVAVAKTVTAGHRLNVGSGMITAISSVPSGGTIQSKPQPPAESPSSGNFPSSNQRGPGLGGSLRKF
jgi:hypothetical protein